MHLTQPLQIAVNHLKYQIMQRGDLPYISVKKQLAYIDELTCFPLGQSLLEKRSISTFWTDFITTHSNQKTDLNLEDFILNRSAFTLAWRELLQNFKKILQGNLKDNIVLASIPCGAMREILELDYSFISNFSLIGIDIDPDSLFLASQTAKKTGLFPNLQLRQEDAWQLSYHSEIDLIASCGLNIYIADRQKTLALYRRFLAALKPGGKLVISFLTYPPGEKMISEWHLDKISSEDLFLEKVLYKDILDMQWRNFQTSEGFESELKKANFSDVTFYYDTLHVFPTVVAKK